MRTHRSGMTGVQALGVSQFAITRPADRRCEPDPAQHVADVQDEKALAEDSQKRKSSGTRMIKVAR
jgi:hypothetical protein